MTDTHTHLYMDAFLGEEAAVVQRAIDAGVEHLVFPCVDADSLPPMRELRMKFPRNIHLAIGLHPTELGDDYSSTLMEMEKMIESGEFCAIGETGIDLYWDKSRLADQLDSFAIQVEWARKYNLPLIIHCREGLEECLGVLEDAKSRGVLPKMIFHSFTQGPDEVKRIREVCDPYFGINGVVTFKNAPLLRESLKIIGLERIVLETDSPYLAPVPHRGSRNESSYIPLICNVIADTLQVAPEIVEKITDNNAGKLFATC